MKQRILSIGAGILVAAALAAATQTPLRAQTAVTSPTPQPAVTNAVASGSPATAILPSSEDIRDIRGPKAIPSPELWFLWLAGGAVLAALGYGARRWYRHVSTAPKLPYEIALERLEKARELMTVKTAREFSIEVSEIVRSYIEARFQVRAVRQTTEEFLHGLLEPSDALLAEHRELLAEFLHHCDLAKFARWILSLEEMEAMHRIARIFVVETGKVPKPSATTQAVAQSAPLEREPAHS
jgi:hypothetical protein